MNDVYKSIEVYSPEKKRKLLIRFDDMIAGVTSNRTYHPVFSELIIGGWKLDISFVFITHSYLLVPGDVRLNSTYFFIIEIFKK